MTAQESDVESTPSKDGQALPASDVSGFFLNYTPDPIGVMLGTGYHRFEHASGIEGLARVIGDQLDVLAVISPNPGKGQFREFIGAAKRAFRTVAVWEVWNPIIGPALQRYGFTPAQCVETDGEINRGWQWSSPKN